MKSLKDEFKDGYERANDRDASLSELLEGTGHDYGGSLDDSELASLDQQVTDLQAEGWNIKKRAPDHVVMRYGDLGSGLIHVLLFIFTLGLGNVVYAWYRWTRYGQQKVVRP